MHLNTPSVELTFVFFICFYRIRTFSFVSRTNSTVFECSVLERCVRTYTRIPVEIGLFARLNVVRLENTRDGPSTTRITMMIITVEPRKDNVIL